MGLCRKDLVLHTNIVLKWTIVVSASLTYLGYLLGDYIWIQKGVGDIKFVESKYSMALEDVYNNGFF